MYVYLVVSRYMQLYVDLVVARYMQWYADLVVARYMQLYVDRNIPQCERIACVTCCVTTSHWQLHTVFRGCI